MVLNDSGLQNKSAWQEAGLSCPGSIVAMSGKNTGRRGYILGQEISLEAFWRHFNKRS